MQQPTQEIVKKQEQTEAEKFVYSTGWRKLLILFEFFLFTMWL
jgi:hypothetical protein